MQAQARTNTQPELALRRQLHRRGLRYRLHVRPLASFRRRADLVFRAARVAVFVDGCFWHSCPEHGSVPRTNRAWWQRKLSRTVARDRETDAELARAGWLVVRVWEHEDVSLAADHVEQAVRQRRSRSR